MDLSHWSGPINRRQLVGCGYKPLAQRSDGSGGCLRGRPATLRTETRRPKTLREAAQYGILAKDNGGGNPDTSPFRVRDLREGLRVKALMSGRKRFVSYMKTLLTKVPEEVVAQLAN